MSGDLISRSALLTELRNCPYVVDFNYVLKIIENAPTVETTFREVVAYECGQKSVERPQGEWMESDIPESLLAKCSICGFDCGAYTHNFCPNCGADMRGKENDLYREETCDRKSHCTDYEYWHCIGCNGCKRREAKND